jgi:malonyl-CoA decarboxylase
MPEKRSAARPFLTRLLGSLARPPARHAAAAGRVIELCHALMSERGEVSMARLAGEVLTAYMSLDGDGVEQFFDLLVDEFSPDHERVHRAAETYAVDRSPANLVRLQAAVDPPRQELFRRWNAAPGGTGVLVAMRRRLLRTLGEHPNRAGIDIDLLHLFRSWFGRGFLVMQRIDWRTSALVLERLIQYEAVHEIQGWRDLRRRLEADRRCYAFFHPALPDEPLIFIEVALTRGLSGHVQPLLDAERPVFDPGRADTAMFYSITNCQEGLRGVSFGSFLIKQAVEDLGREFPRLRTFATLSPIPGFRRWLTSAAAADHRSPDLDAWLARIAGRDTLDDEPVAAARQQELCKLCGYYLMSAKSGQMPMDPVERFHLANGARLERLNWMGDSSETGIKRSFGLMVNYLYRLADVERNHEAYAKDYRIVASRAFEREYRRG